MISLPQSKFMPHRIPAWVALGALFLSLGAVVSTEAARPTKQQRIRTLRTRLKTLNQQMEVKEAELRQTKRTQRRLSDQLNDSYQRLEAANSALKTSEERLRAAEAAVREATVRLQAAEARLDQQRARFGRRIAASYEEGPVTFLDVLVGARNLSDFMDRQYYVSCVMDQDAELLTSLRQAQEAVKREWSRLEERKTDLEAAHADNAERVREVANETVERAQLLQEIKEQRALQEQQLGELEEDSQDVQRSLEADLARRQANPGSYRNLPQWSGSLYMPARGPITSRFGYRYHPVLHYQRLHSGIDIGAGAGSPVYAAGAGEVFFASWRGGYGQCIIILHGGGISTLYGHLSQIRVRAGQSVRRGQHIGAVGSTGLSTGPHLHFEVRRNGAPVNPL